MGIGKTAIELRFDVTGLTDTDSIIEYCTRIHEHITSLMSLVNKQSTRITERSLKINSAIKPAITEIPVMIMLV